MAISEQEKLNSIKELLARYKISLPKDKIQLLVGNYDKIPHEKSVMAAPYDVRLKDFVEQINQDSSKDDTSIENLHTDINQPFVNLSFAEFQSLSLSEQKAYLLYSRQAAFLKANSLLNILEIAEDLTDKKSQLSIKDKKLKKIAAEYINEYSYNKDYLTDILSLIGPTITQGPKISNDTINSKLSEEFNFKDLTEGIQYIDALLNKDLHQNLVSYDNDKLQKLIIIRQQDSYVKAENGLGYPSEIVFEKPMQKSSTEQKVVKPSPEEEMPTVKISFESTLSKHNKWLEDEVKAKETEFKNIIGSAYEKLEVNDPKQVLDSQQFLSYEKYVEQIQAAHVEYENKTSQEFSDVKYSKQTDNVRSSIIRNEQGQKVCEISEVTDNNGIRHVKMPQSLEENMGPATMKMAVKNEKGQEPVPPVYYIFEYDKKGNMTRAIIFEPCDKSTNPPSLLINNVRYYSPIDNKEQAAIEKFIAHSQADKVTTKNKPVNIIETQIEDPKITAIEKNVTARPQVIDSVLQDVEEPKQNTIEKPKLSPIDESFTASRDKVDSVLQDVEPTKRKPIEGPQLTSVDKCDTASRPDHADDYPKQPQRSQRQINPPRERPIMKGKKSSRETFGQTLARSDDSDLPSQEAVQAAYDLINKKGNSPLTEDEQTILEHISGLKPKNLPAAQIDDPQIRQEHSLNTASQLIDSDLQGVKTPTQSAVDKGDTASRPDHAEGHPEKPQRSQRKINPPRKRPTMRGKKSSRGTFGGQRLARSDDADLDLKTEIKRFKSYAAELDASKATIKPGQKKDGPAKGK